MVKKLFCIMLMLCMAITIYPAYAIGASGVCGDDAEWYTSGTTLYITGTGDVESRGWDDLKENIWSVVISEGITSLPGEAFDNCPHLETVSLPSTLKTIGMHAFRYASFSSITIPNGVETIGNGAFYGAELTSITIPQSVKTIDSYAFHTCNKMTTVNIVGNNLKTIGSDAFRSCSELSSINLPYGLEVIEQNVFYYCKKLETISIPQTVKHIGSGAFSYSGCASNDAYQTPGDLYIDGCLLSIYNDGDTLGTYTVRPGTRLIAEAAGASSGYDNYVLPSSVEYICNSAFGFNKDIVSINLPAGLKEIGDAAFAYCEKLNSVSIPDTVTEICPRTFDECKSLSSVTIPDSVTKIGSEAFNDCSSLVNLNIPDSVTSIGKNAYKNTGYSVFETSWTDGLLYYNEYLLQSSDFVPEEVTIKKGTRLIADGALSDACFDIKNITLPNGLQIIGNEAFRYCQITGIGIPESVTHIGDGAFMYCKKIEKMQLPEGLKYLGKSAFHDCEKLTEINIPASIGEIQSDSFSYCPITHIEIPDGITAIGDCAFLQCNGVIAISIPDSVKSIGTEALPNAKTIVIPKSVTSIGKGAINSTTTTVFIPSVGNKSDMWRLKKLFFSEYYQQTLKTLKITNETEIVSKAFYELKGNIFINLNDGVKSIEDYAFAETDGLTVLIPSTVTTISENAFENAQNITLQVFENSEALKYAKTHSVPYEIISGRTEKIYVDGLQKNGKTMLSVVTDGCGKGRIVGSAVQSGWDTILEAKHLNITDNGVYVMSFDRDDAYGVRAFRFDENLAPLTEPEYVKVQFSDFD